jgi:hypothetical protein
MPGAELPDELRAPFRTVQILWAALLGGAFVFYLVAIILRAAGSLPPPPEQPVLGYAAVAAGLVLAAASLLVPPMVRASRLRQRANAALTPAEWFAAWQTAFLVRVALLEGGVSLALVCFLVEPTDLSRYTALGLIILLAAVRPVRGQVADELARRPG